MKNLKLILFPIISLVVIGSIYGGSFWGIQSYISSQVEKPNDSTSFNVDDFQILSMGDNHIEIFLNISINNSLDNSASYDFEVRNLKMIVDNELLIEYKPDSYEIINTASNRLLLTLNFIIYDQQALFDVIQSILNQENIYIDFLAKIKVKGIATIFPSFTIKKEILVNSTDLMKSDNKEDLFDIHFNTIDIDTDNLKCALNISITLKNNLNIAFNITSIFGKVDFDDLDGAGFVILPKDNVFIAEFNYNWNNDPFQLLPKQNSTRNILFSEELPDLLTSTRIYDDYFRKDQFYVDITEGLIGLEIAGYSFSFPFVLNDIYVPLMI